MATGDYSKMRSKDFIAISKSRLHAALFAILNPNFKIEPVPVSLTRDKGPTYKCYLEVNGNNFGLVKTVLKKRSWFAVSEMPTCGYSALTFKGCSLVWT